MFDTEFQDASFNPYIVFSDITLNLVLILVFFVAVLNVIGQTGWEQIRYKDAQSIVRNAIQEALDENRRPIEDNRRNDPPGVQRWSFPSELLFFEGTTNLTSEGEDILTTFVKVLAENGKWRRIRIEGHTKPPIDRNNNDWEISAARATTAVKIFENWIPPWFLTVSGRAGQDPINPNEINDPRNQRIDILLEYSSEENSFESVKDK